ncbi:MAG: 50S ribosome-binding GTPase [Planctomycetaceae bacterium]|jgi:GTP-binding protein EngB required for normal cell division|nr:50S ribosome-binding GTPase [Planctomycetaceae bacterium]
MSLTDSVETGELFRELSALVIDLYQSVKRLGTISNSCGVKLPEGEDWFELLSRKLLPQVGDCANLIVAVMGGTNTGKSLIFNHIVGDNCSGVDYRASGTKHPVCVASGKISNPLDILQRNFGNFNIETWSSPNQPLEPNTELRLFWKTSNNLPNRILVIDTPDIDSDNERNWSCARGVRHASDVIIAVLTGQKYNDAIIRRFFREASEAAKPIIVVFNMINPERDLEHIPNWINQFCEETHTTPITILFAKFDANKSSALELPFYQSTTEVNPLGNIVDLRRVLTELHFDRIKSQTLVGAIRVIIDKTNGLPEFLNRIELAAKQFSKALKELEQSDNTTKIEWPAIPISILTEELRKWWHEEKRPIWSRKINDIYKSIGNKLIYPLVKLYEIIVQKFSHNTNPNEKYGNQINLFKEKESAAVVTFIETIFNRLDNLARTDNHVLRREISMLTCGEKRVELLNRAKIVLEELEPLDTSLRKTIRNNLAQWTEKNPIKTNIIQSIDQALTLVRPAVTVSLVVSGFVIGSVIAAPLVDEIMLIGGITAGGEAIIHSATETIKSNLAKLLKQLQEEFIVSRSKKFHTTFLHELWNDIINRLHTGANVTNSKEFQDCQVCLQRAIEIIK